MIHTAVIFLRQIVVHGGTGRSLKGEGALFVIQTCRAVNWWRIRIAARPSFRAAQPCECESCFRVAGFEVDVDSVRISGNLIQYLVALGEYL